jgi:DNA-binding transcriptional LysR family regulator
VPFTLPASLVAQTIAPNTRVLRASPAFVARHGVPDTPKALRAFRCIALPENDEDVTLWRFTGPDGAVDQVRIEPALASNDGDVVREWALGGHGIVLRSEWHVADDVRDGRLVSLLPEYRAPPPPARVRASRQSTGCPPRGSP